MAKRKSDPRARSNALPPTRRAVGIAPNTKLRTRVASETCNVADCENRPVICRTIPATTKCPMRVERYCIEHMDTKPEPRLTLDEILSLIADEKQDMTEWDYHPSYKTEIVPDTTIVLIPRNPDGSIKW